MKPIFGPAGNSEEFYDAGYKRTIPAMKFLYDKGLDAYDYQCGRGVNIGQATAEQLGEEAKKYGIKISLHAPYYTSLASVDEQKRLNSIKYVIDSARAVDWMGGNRVVVHPGGLAKMTREEATNLACNTIELLIKELDEQHLGHITICFETMGKINQLGNLQEVLRFCSMDDRFLPCIDFGHLNARTHGECSTREQIKAVFDEIENALGHERMLKIHSHFSKIEYSKGGEVKHLTFEDEIFGPDIKPVLDETFARGAYPTFICESAGTQSQDALAMKQYYMQISGDTIANK